MAVSPENSLASISPVDAQKRVAINQTEDVIMEEVDPNSQLAVLEDVIVSDNEEDGDESEDESSSDKHPHTYESEFPEDMLDGEYTVQERLGRGAFGLVALAHTTAKHPHLPSGTPVAIKKLSNIFNSAVGAKRLIRELRILRMTDDHPCIVKLIDIKIPKEDLRSFNTILLIFERVDSDLNAPFTNTSTFYTEDQVKSVFKQMLYGLKFMHSAQLVHRDLKPQNILVNNKENGELEVKLCDFGLARCISEHNFKQPQIETCLSPKGVARRQTTKLQFKKDVTKHVVTRYYRPPEVSLLCQERELIPAIDMWSMGCILGELLQMMSQNRPNPRHRKVLLKGMYDEILSPDSRYRNYSKVSKSQLEVIFNVLGKPDQDFIDAISDPESKKYVQRLKEKKTKSIEEIFPYGPPEATDLLKDLLKYNPRERYTVDDALNHPWLEDVPGLEERNLDRTHETVIFDFEDIELSRFDIRLLVIDEIAHYIPEINKFESVMEMRSHGTMPFEIATLKKTRNPNKSDPTQGHKPLNETN